MTAEQENKVNEVLETVSEYLQPTTRVAVFKNIKINKSFRQSTKVSSISRFLEKARKNNLRSPKASTNNRRSPRALDESEHQWRLPKTSTPISYDLHLISNIHTGDLNVDGEISIKLKVLETTNRLTLHSKNISIEVLTLFDAADKEVTISNYSLYTPTEILTVYLISEVSPNSEFTLKVKYQFVMYDPPNTDMVGFYRTSYLTDAGTRRFVVNLF